VNNFISLHFKCNSHFTIYFATELTVHHVNGTIILMMAKCPNKVIPLSKSIQPLILSNYAFK